MTLMWKEIMEQPAVLKNCFDENYDTVLKIADTVKSQNIRYGVIAARGTSDHAGIYGKYMMETYAGIPVGLAAPSVTSMYGADINFSSGMVIGISQSGEAKDVLSVLKAANKKGAVTVGITNYVDSPIAKEANFHLWCNAGPEKSVAATKTFTAQMMILGMLAGALSESNAVFDELKKVPDLIKTTLDDHEKINGFVNRYTYAQEFFILARGFNYAIALESGLKIQETTYIRAKAYAVSDFYHGPFAMLTPQIPVIMYATEGPLLGDANNMLDKLADKNLEVIVVSNDQDSLNKGAESFKIPKCHVSVAPFLCAAFAQMFACKLSLSKRLNPDKPRDLNKVTITV